MNAGSTIKVEVVMAWPRRCEAVSLTLPPGSTVAGAVTAAGISGTGAVTGYALHGVRALPTTLLREGDRVELLRPLQMDPKDARRARAGVGKGRDDGAGG